MNSNVLQALCHVFGSCVWTNLSPRLGANRVSHLNQSLTTLPPSPISLQSFMRHFPTRAVQQLCTPKLPGNDRFCLQCLHLIPTCTATRHIPLFLYSRGFVARIRLTSLFVKLKCSRRSRTKHEYSRLISCPYHRPWPRHDSMTVHEVKTI